MTLLGHPLCRLLGFHPTGDLADLTFYTSKRNGVVFFVKAPPLEPPSVMQLHQRNKFRIVAELWRLLPKVKRQAWETATLRGGLKMTGYNLYTYWHLTRDRATIETIEAFTHVPLL